MLTPASVRNELIIEDRAGGAELLSVGKSPMKLEYIAFCE